MNIKEILEFGINKLKENNIKDPIFKSKILLANTLNKSKEYLLINEQEVLEEENVSKYTENIEKLCKNIPLQYLTNKQEFMGLDFFVNENVLIPQPDTEILVEEVIDICKNEYKDKEKICILDLCTGSGCIGISIEKKINNSKVILSDISNQALDVAKNNSIKHDTKLEIIQSDLFNNINSKFDIIVSNPPYIKTDVIKTLDKEVQNEPQIALDGGEDGLNVYRRIVNEAYNYLNENGYLCLEIGYDQKDEVIKLLKNEEKYKDTYCKKDLENRDRIIVCKKIKGE